MLARFPPATEGEDEERRDNLPKNTTSSTESNDDPTG